MKNYLVFTIRPTYKFNVVQGEEERDRVIEDHKKLFPSLPIYWVEVQEG